MTHTTTKSAAAALLVAAALGGCGSSSDDNATAPVSTTPDVTTASTPVATTASTTPAGSSADVAKAKWANQLCTTLALKAKPVQPPSVAASTPAATKASLVTFFTTVVSTQTIQLQTLKALGEPPSKNAVADWKTAIKELRSIRKKVTAVEKNLESTPATNQKQLAGVMATLGKETTALASYNGPVSELAKNGAIGPSLKAEPACGALL